MAIAEFRIGIFGWLFVIAVRTTERCVLFRDMSREEWCNSMVGKLCC
jgi:hypothetical protein